MAHRGDADQQGYPAGAGSPAAAGADPASSGEVEGIDAERVSAWFAANIPDVALPLRFELVAGGRSNLTYRVSDAAGHHWALRRPPTGHLLPTAHDMGREHRILAALGPAGIPVPAVRGYCEDDSVTGGRFYVMDFVEGHILRTQEIAETELDSDARHHAGLSLIDTLADLHAVDVDAIGLGDLGRREDYIRRQLKRWRGQIESAQGFVDGEDLAALGRVHELLAARVPEQVGVGIVHGDYRLDNCVLADDGTVKAILDWELCTLGDPLADLGFLMVYWTDTANEPPALQSAPTLAPGFVSRAELRDRYAARTGRDLSRLEFYVTFGYWKLACILSGVLTRYVNGQAAGDRSGVDSYIERIHLFGRQAEHAAGTLA